MDITSSPIEYRDGDLLMKGEFFFEQKDSEVKPGILLVHDAWGVGAYPLKKARKLAELGYRVLVADLYGNRLHVETLDQARGLVGGLKNDPASLRSRARAALDCLAGQTGVDNKRLGAIGFCFGGTTVLELARSGYDVAGVVSFHGELDTQMPAKIGDVKAKILVCTGAIDPLVPPARVESFQKEMNEADADFQVVIYSGAAHSFTNPDATSRPGVAYNECADQRSWRAMQQHFEEIFSA